jgi:hypothetical protein
LSNKNPVGETPIPPEERDDNCPGEERLKKVPEMQIKERGAEKMSIVVHR